MMKNIILIIFILTITRAGYGQFSNPPNPIGQSCEVNVNAYSSEDFRNDIKRASFKINLTQRGEEWDCSATLINRNTGQNEMGQYFISAWHCFRDRLNCNGEDYIFNNPINLIFNYQSPDGENKVFSQNRFGDVYEISRQVRLVDKFSCAYGDFALCEILGDPIPPYFNVYYAGWYPNELYVARNGTFATIHHPLGTIKKISSTDNLINSANVNAVKASCVTITKVIDFLLGWIWKRKWSTQVVCTYLQLPFTGPKYEVKSYNYGIIEEGSSGAGLFTGESGFAGANRFIGNVSAAVPTHHCDPLIDVGISYFGKFSDNYYRQSVKNTLNPSNDYWIDQGGIPGRQISCYPQININAGAGTINLYPASFYQQQNAITLTAQSTFVTNGTVNVISGADYTFQAGETIDLNPGFETEAGATFFAAATPSPCVIDGNARLAANGSMYDAPDLKKSLQKTSVLQYKKFDINKYLPATVAKTGDNVNSFTLYPNPSTGNINVELFLKEKEKNVQLDIYDLYGRHVYSKKYNDIYFIKEKLTLPSANSGMYNLIIKTNTNTYSKRIILAH